MHDSALYFPLIEVPEHPSLTRVLLYWDQVGSIIPPVALSERLQELIDAELVDAVDPVPYIENRGVEFADGFFQILDGLPSEITDGVHRDGVWSRVATIHVEKATDFIWEELTARGLAQPERGPWMAVAEPVAAVFMAYLAGFLGQQHDLGMEPITDRPEYFVPYLTSDPRQSLTHRLDSARAVVLRNVLPAPAEPVAVAELAAFKRANWDLLQSFRIEVEGRLLDCAREPAAGVRERLLHHKARELEEQVAEIEARMGQLGRPTARGVFCASLPAVYAVARFVATGDAVDPAEIGIPLITEVLRSSGSAATETAEAPALAYAALAWQAFGDAV
jgi:hypothetical protein